MKTSSKLTKLVLLLVAAAVLATGIVIYGGFIRVGADIEHRPLSQWLLQTVRERAVARAARKVEVKLPRRLEGDALLASIASFDDMCASCHTPPGRTPGLLARGLNPPAPDLARAAEERSPAELFWVMRHGIRMTGMPAWGRTHADEELWALVALIRRLPEMDGKTYEVLLDAAREAGLGHEHDHNGDGGHAAGHRDDPQHEEPLRQHPGDGHEDHDH